jgi:hypothetical protein
MLNRKGEGKNKSTFQDEGLRTIGTGGQRWRELLPDTSATLDYGQHLLEHSTGLPLAVCVVRAVITSSAAAAAGKFGWC